MLSLNIILLVLVSGSQPPPPSPQPLATIHVGSALKSVAVSPDGKYVVGAANQEDYHVVIIELSTGKVVRNLTAHANIIQTVAISPDGKYIVSGSWDTTLKIWDFGTGKLIRTLKGHSSNVLSIAVTRDGKHIVSGSTDQTIKIWDFERSEAIMTIEAHAFIYTVSTSHDGKYIVSGRDDGKIDIWKLADGSQVKTLDTLTYSSLRSVLVTPDGKHIVSGGSDQTVKVWTLPEGDLVATLFQASPTAITSVAITPDGKYIFGGTAGSRVKVWEFPADGQDRLAPDDSFDDHTLYVNDIKITPDEKFLVTGSNDRTIRVTPISSFVQTTCNSVDETRMSVKYGDTKISPVEVVEGMSGWKVNGMTTAVHEIPDVLLREGMFGYFVSDQSSGNLMGGSKFHVSCPANCKKASCEVVVVVYHCPPCSSSTNGGFLKSLPSNGWHPGSCSPKFQINNNNDRHRMTSFYKQIAPGTQETIEVSSPLQHTAIFGRVNAVDCGKKTTQQTCVDSFSCKWDASSDDRRTCVPNWCTTSSKGPHQQPAGTCGPCAV